mgnify:CR=1 FL=1
MADEISDDKFKSDVLRFIEVAMQKFDGLTSDLRSNSFKIDRMESKVDQIETKVDRVESDLKKLSSDVNTLTRQFEAVGAVAIEDHQPSTVLRSG